MSDNPYCDKSVVKDRMLIAQADNSYNDALDQAIEEASRMVDIFLMPYEDTLPLNEANITAQIEQITGDFSASIFKRRMVPGEVAIRGALQPNPMDIVSEMDASGWFAIGIRKLELYIKAKYTLAQEVGNTVHNPDIWANLFEKGLITGMEARAGINDATQIVIKRLEEITKELATNETIKKDITTTENATIKRDIEERSLITKRQSSFAFVSGDKDGEYKKDSEYSGEPPAEEE